MTAKGDSSRAVCYGDKVKLFTYSPFARSTVEKLGGYIGAYCTETGASPFLVIPPVQRPYDTLLKSCYFRIEQVTSASTVVSPASDASLLQQSNNNSNSNNKSIHVGDFFHLIPVIVTSDGSHKEIPRSMIFPDIAPIPFSTIVFSFTKTKGPPQGTNDTTTSNTNIVYNTSTIVLNVMKPNTKGKGQPPTPLQVNTVQYSGLNATCGALSTIQHETSHDFSIEIRPLTSPLIQVDFSHKIGTNNSNTTTTIDVPAFNTPVAYYNGPTIPTNATIKITIPDFGTANLSLNTIQTPPISSLPLSYAPPTTVPEWFEYKDHIAPRQTPPIQGFPITVPANKPTLCHPSVGITTPLHNDVDTIDIDLPITGRIADASISVRLARRAFRMAPVEFTSETSKQHPSFIRPKVGILSFPLIIVFTTLVCYILSQILLSVGPTQANIIRYTIPSIIILFILVLLPKIYHGGYSMNFRPTASTPSQWVLEIGNINSALDTTKLSTVLSSHLSPQASSSSFDGVTNNSSLSAIALSETGSHTTGSETNDIASSPVDNTINSTAPSLSHHTPAKPRKSVALFRSPSKASTVSISYPTPLNNDTIELIQTLESIGAVQHITDGNFTNISALVSVGDSTKQQINQYRESLVLLHNAKTIDDKIRSPAIQTLIEAELPEIKCTVNSCHPSIGGPATVKAYYPLMFKAIREAHGISPQDMTDAWTFALDSLPKGGVGAGRSGAIFMRSKCGRFIFKTLGDADMKSLHMLIHDYATYVTSHSSMLMRFFDVIKITFANGVSRRFLIGANVFYLPPSIPQIYGSITKYDLKGRTPKKNPENRLQIAQCDVFKDNQISRVFQLHHTVREQVVQNIASDVEWLRNHDCIDYSLLVGVCENTSSAGQYIIPDNSYSHRNVGTPGYVKALSDDELFQIGIVDFLARYKTWQKRVAHTMKRSLWRNDELSTVNADYYATRFSDYIKIVFPTIGAILVRSKEEIEELFKQWELPLNLPQDAIIALQPQARSAGTLVVAPNGQHIVIVPRGVSAAPVAKYERDNFNDDPYSHHDSVSVSASMSNMPNSPNSA